MNRSDLLTMLLYGLDIATRPTFANMSRSYESWLHYNRLHPSQLSRLGTGGMVERSLSDSGASWAVKLTKKGRLKALGGRDPEERWSRAWDGTWRLLLFDIPTGNEKLRRKLYTWLRKNYLGCLQKSVWLSPDSFSEVSDILGEESESAAKVIAFGGAPCFRGAKTDQEIVEAAWNFSEINQRYQDYIAFAKAGIPKKIEPDAALEWVRSESSTWTRSVSFDPLLPSALLPTGYLGKKAWEARRALLKKAAPMTMALGKQ